MLVFDATPLIYLATVDRLGWLDDLDDPRVIPQAVFDEVVTAGIEAGYPDARRIERAVERGSFAVEPDPETALSSRLRRSPTLSEADVAAIALAAAREATAILDDRSGRAAAAAEAVPTRGTVSILLDLVDEDHRGPREARECLDEMIEAGWYCSTDLYARIVRVLDSLE